MNSTSADLLARHKEVVLQLYSECWNAADFTNMTELMNPKITFNARGKTHQMMAEDLIDIVARWREGFPDFRFEVDDLVAEGDRVAARVSYTGTHKGEVLGIDPTGRKVHVHEMMFFRMENERIAEVWEVPDRYSLRSQLLQDDE
ncbi:MAG: ester cyclase [Anaerolineales bacterium]|nr:ester cyclase [Anaerolineales bacterium]